MFEFDAAMPTRLIVGEGAVDRFPEAVRKYGSKAMLVTGSKSMKASGYTDRVIKTLKAAGISTVLFDQVRSNPTRETTNEGGEMARRERVDMVIGLGGGSALDVAKGIAVLAMHGEDIWDFVEGREIESPALPIIGIPSTAGTGSEVTKYAVFSDDAAKRKDGFGSDYIFPSIAVIDPKLMSTVPPDLTAKAGGDVLAQGIESYLTKLAHPLSDMYSRESIRLCGEYLGKAYRNGKDLEARAAMGYASSLTGIAISWVDVVVGHHVSEAVGALYHTHHGETAAVLLPFAMEFNFEQTQKRLADIAGFLGVDTVGMSREASALAAIAAVRKILKDIGIPYGLKSLGVKEDSFDSMLNILDNRTGDLEAGNYREINRNTLEEFLRKAM